MGNGDELLQRFGLNYITPIENLPSILEHGLLSRSAMLARGVGFVDISDHDVQALRERQDPVYGRPIHDYVPLFLNHRNAMLYSRKELQDRLVILTIDRRVSSGPGVLFCDGNAAAVDTVFSTDTNILAPCREALEAEYWTGVKDGRRRRMAEVLVPDVVPCDAIVRAVCNNTELLGRIQREFDLSASVDTSFFFADR